MWRSITATTTENASWKTISVEFNGVVGVELDTIEIHCLKVNSTVPRKTKGQRIHKQNDQSFTLLCPPSSKQCNLGMMYDGGYEASRDYCEWSIV